MILKAKNGRSTWFLVDSIRLIKKYPAVVRFDDPVMEAIPISYVKTDITQADEREQRESPVGVHGIWISQNYTSDDIYGNIVELTFISGEGKVYFVQEAYVMNDKGVTIERL